METMKKVYSRPEVWVSEQIVSTKMLMVSIGFWDEQELPEGPIMGE